MTDDVIEIDPESTSIQAHLGIIQNVIQRMSANSTNSKAWCVSLVAAILVIVADKDKPSYAWIALLPTIVFAFLDAYYLALEKSFRNSYNHFVSKLRTNKLTEQDLYSIVPVGDTWRLQLCSLASFSIWGFYVPLLLLIWITKTIALA
jgi:hypothetical protein